MSRIEVAILGAGGKVGSTILRELSQDPDVRVRGICRNEITAGPLRLEGLEVTCGDASDPEQAESLLSTAQVIVNCAAASGPPGRARAQDEALCRSIAKLSGSRRIVHFSSVAVYGSCIDAARNTFEDPSPDDPYGRDKLHLESFLAKQIPSKRHALVVLRLGHVYGERQWVSRYVFTYLDAGMGLPFDGRYPSNAIHVRNVVAAVRHLATTQVAAGTYNLVDSPARTWREIFDWNTDAAALPSVPSMDDAVSQVLLERYRGQAAAPLPKRAAREVTAWAKTVPHALLSSAPAVRAAGAILLANLKLEPFEQFASMSYSSAFAGAARRRTEVPDYPKLSKLLCDGAPGPMLVYPPARSDRDVLEVGAWYRTYSSPDSIRDAAAALVARAPVASA